MITGAHTTAATAGTLYRLQQVSLQLGPVTALSAVDLRIDRGERVALIGANGSGKSSLLRVLHGLVAPSSGLATRASGSGQGASQDLRQAMLFQRPHLLRTSVINNVALGLWVQGQPWRVAKTQAQTALERVALGDLAARSAKGLSGGQQQRVALARAWSLRPDVLLLDEPTASLDPHAKREVEALMAELGDEGITLVFASHNLGQVKRLATRVVYLERGRLLADLPVDAFFDKDHLAKVSPEADLFVRGEMV
jgi:tungstate transport system ATP-binding protein